MRPSDPTIQFDRLTRSFGDTVALDEVDLFVRGGVLLCLLGRNGAGKTTAMRSIMGLTRPSRGDVRIDGISVESDEVHAVRRSIGYLAEDPALYDELSGHEFLRFIAELYSVPTEGTRSAQRLVERLELGEAADQPIRSYSMGMRKKIAFIAAVLHQPRILVLDEPTVGLDAVSARIVKETMVRYRDRGRLVLFSTHVMELAERWADRIAILDAGRLVFDGDLDALRRRHTGADREPASLESLFLRVTGDG